MRHVSRLLCTATALGLSAPAEAESVTLADLFAVDRLARIGMTWALTAARSVAHVTFVDMDVDPLGARMALTGLEVIPYEMPFDGACSVSVDRVVITSAPLLQFTHASMDIDLVGVSVSPGCLEPEVGAILGEFGVADIAFDHATVGIDYAFATGALAANISAVSPEIADIRANVLFDYFSIDANSEEPIADFSRAEVELIDLGLMSMVGPLLPPEARDPDMLAQLLRVVILPEAMPSAPETAPGQKEGNGKGETDGSGTDGGSVVIEREQTPPTPEVLEASAMIDEIAVTLATFVQTPGRLVFTLQPEAPVRLDEDLIDSFPSFATVLRPAFATGPARVAAALTAADQSAILSAQGDAGALPAGERLRYARAFLTGLGAPRDTDLGTDLLEPLLESGDRMALALALDHLPALDPETAYRVALSAAAAGDRTAFAHLDGLEQTLDVATMLAVQSGTGAAPQVAAGEDARSNYQRGFLALTGLGAPRSYMHAYFYGLYALAGGETAAAAIIDEVEAFGTRLAADEAELWANELAGVRASVQNAWFAAR